MLNWPLKNALLIVLITGLILVFSGFTDADLVAERTVKNNLFSTTTLSFGSLNTANFSKLESFFNISNLFPGGFDVRAVEIRKEGKMNFKYRIFSKISGDPLCQVLNIKVVNKNFNEYYNGKLKDLVVDSQIKDQEKDVWIFFVELPETAGDELKNKTCEFEIVFRTWRNFPFENTGFFAERKLKNTVSTGNG